MFWCNPNDRIYLESGAWANRVDPDQTAPVGAVWSGSTMFAALIARLRVIDH